MSTENSGLEAVNALVKRRFTSTAGTALVLPGNARGKRRLRALLPAGNYRAYTTRQLQDFQDLDEDVIGIGVFDIRYAVPAAEAYDILARAEAEEGR